MKTDHYKLNKHKYYKRDSNKLGYDEKSSTFYCRECLQSMNNCNCINWNELSYLLIGIIVLIILFFIGRF